jgi:hypothetical protein
MPSALTATNASSSTSIPRSSGPHAHTTIVDSALSGPTALSNITRRSACVRFIYAVSVQRAGPARTARTQGFQWSSISQKFGWRRARKRRRQYRLRGKLDWRRDNKRPASEKRGLDMEAGVDSEATGTRRSEVGEGVAEDEVVDVETSEFGNGARYAELRRRTKRRESGRARTLYYISIAASTIRRHGEPATRFDFGPARSRSHVRHTIRKRTFILIERQLWAELNANGHIEIVLLEHRRHAVTLIRSRTLDFNSWAWRMRPKVNIIYDIASRAALT